MKLFCSKTKLEDPTFLQCFDVDELKETIISIEQIIKASSKKKIPIKIDNIVIPNEKDFIEISNWLLETNRPYLVSNKLV